MGAATRSESGRGPCGALALLLCCVACAPGAGPSEPPPVNVVLIVIDTLRRDHLSAYGYELETSPALDRLAAEALRYDAAISQAPWTTPSIGALMTSRYPTALGIRGERNALSGELELLPEALAGAGYHTAGVISHSFLGSDWNFDQGFEVFNEEHVLGHAAVTSEGVTEVATRLAGQLAAEAEPFFLFVHYFDPHAAYVEHEASAFGGAGDYAGEVKSGLLFKELRGMTDRVDAEDLHEIRRLYDSEIRFTDGHIGRLLEQLRESGAWDDTLIIVTADHGEEFLDHGQFGHAKSLYEELVGVPLLIKAPARLGITPGVVEEPVALVDLYPTILEVTGVPGPDDLEGEPLLPVAPLGRPIFTETGRGGRGFAVVDGGLKLIVQRDGSCELYDLHADRAEQTDLAEARPADVERLGALVEEWREAQRGKVKGGAKVQLDRERSKRIENLGYGGD